MRSPAPRLSTYHTAAGTLLVWLLFGAVAVPIVADTIDWRIVLYAVVSLTALRMASVVFGLLAVEELGPTANTAVATLAATVLLSVVAHGVTAEPLAERYGTRLATPSPAPPPSVTARS